MRIEHPLASFVARVADSFSLDEADRTALLSLSARVVIHPAGTQIVRQGDSADSCIFLIDGFLSRTKNVGDSRKQILGFCLPGDAADLQPLFAGYADHTLDAHAPSTIAAIRQSDLADLMLSRPNIMRALWLDASVGAAVSREWSLNLGSRSARQRIAHLILETDYRHRASTRSERTAFPLPLKQAALASAVGLSLVHLNKSLQWLRREGLISVHGRRYEILRRDELVAFCGFDPAYLNMRADQRHELCQAA